MNFVGIAVKVKRLSRLLVRSFIESTEKERTKGGGVVGTGAARN